MERIKAIIKYPCCPKEKLVYGGEGKGWVSAKCPNCGKYVRFDLVHLTAELKGAIKGLNN